MFRSKILIMIMWHMMSLDIFATNYPIILDVDTKVSDDWIFFDDDNRPHSFVEYEGKAVLVVFWATWCTYCVAEMPSLEILQKDFRKLPIVIIPISEDFNPLSVVSEFYKNNKLNHLKIFYDQNNSLMKYFQLSGMPSSILIDSEGVVVNAFIGNVNWSDEDIRARIFDVIPGDHNMPHNSSKSSFYKKVND
jgi:thiol-disulfide isomerase/thioredoxin